MFGWLRQLFTKRASPTEAEKGTSKDIADPKMFNPAQRKYLAELFPKVWTHSANLEQTTLLQFAATMNIFGVLVKTPQQLHVAFLIMELQGIIEYNDANHFLLRRV